MGMLSMIWSWRQSVPTNNSLWAPTPRSIAYLWSAAADTSPAGLPPAYCSGRFWFQISMSQKVIVFFILGMVKEISNLPQWCTSRMMPRAATKPQAKNIDGMMLPSSSPKYLQMCLRLRRSWEINWKEFQIRHLYLSSFFSLTSIADKLKQFLCYFAHRTTLLLSWCPLQPFWLQNGKISSYTV